MILNGDDCGFVDTTQDLINVLEENDKEYDKVERLELLENTYQTALQELLDRGYLYEFKDNHSNRVHLIRHWFLHNKYRKGLYTNYRVFREQVHLEHDEYQLGRKPLKEDKLNENNVNETNINQGYTEEEISEALNVFETKENEND